MAIKAHEQVQLDNFAAHLSVIKNNIKIANKELEKSISDRDANKINYKAVEEQIANKYKIIEGLDKDIESKKAYIAMRENAAEVAEARLRKDKEEFETYVQQTLSSLQVKAQSVSESLTDKRNEIKKLEDIIVGLKEQIELLVTKIDEYTSKKYELEAEYKILDNKVIQKNIEFVEVEKDFNNKKEELTKELNGLQKEVEEERKKIELPRKNLEEEKRVLEIKQKDIIILTNRLRKLYKEQGVEISII